MEQFILKGDRMSNIENLKIKFNEVIDLLTVVSRKSEVASVELSKFESKKSELLKEIDILSSKVVELKNLNGSLKDELNNGNNEYTRILNISKSKLEGIEKKEKEVNGLLATITSERESIAKRDLDIKNKLSELKKQSDDFVNKEQLLLSKSEDISKKEIELSNKLKDADIAITEANKKLEEARKQFSLITSANESSLKLKKEIQDELLNKKFVEDNLSKQSKELDDKKQALALERLSLDKRADELTYKELEIEKVIKDKLLGKDVADRNKFEEDKKKFSKEIEDKEKRFNEDKNKLLVEKNSFERLKSDISSERIDLDNKVKLFSDSRKKLDSDIVQLEKDKFEYKKNLEGLKFQEDIIKTNKLRLMKFAREKGLKKELAELEGKGI